ncbi:hypothetical protein [Nocardia iowensis]|uniref:Uncharacterized protein n=1 Tax=Nocardia iowensis TaxID=204891 RepID=A0ABX8RLV1_NOCIO|nr:hypothetical protein [Nocardia iowensis]QXN90281.1 hypothetical protein KV110_33455 [Nocardia iowensis]
MSTRKSTRTRTTGQRKAAPTKAQPTKAEPRKPDPAPEPAKNEQKPFCGTCGARTAPEENDPFLGSALLYDDPGYANLMGAMFLCGWQSQTLQKVVAGRPAVIVVGTPVDTEGNALKNRKIVTATWHHFVGDGWVQFASLCGYSRPDGTGFQTRTAEQLTEYVGRNTAQWVLAPIEEEQRPKPKAAGTRSAGKTRAKAQAKPTPTEGTEDKPDMAAPEPTIDPEAKGLPAGSTPPQDDPIPGTDQEPEPEVEGTDPGDSDLPAEEAAAGVEEEVIDEGEAA